MAFLRRFFSLGRSNEPTPSSKLPADVQDSLEALHVVPRHAGKDGVMRTIVRLPQTQGWLSGPEADERVVRRLWPELSDAQVRRACRHIAAQVYLTSRPVGTGEPQSRNYANRWRYE